MADVSEGEESSSPNLSGIEDNENRFDFIMKRSQQVMKVVKKLNTYKPNIKHLFDKKIVQLDDLNVYFNGEYNEENMNKLLSKLNIDLDIQTLMECPYSGSDKYKIELKRTIKSIIVRLEKICKNILKSEKKYFRNEH
ncbi:hypothetical protein ILUMI_02693 [Ignelater luminosus]|uniref:Uncharacterized protein n=1 Tax=Ignelater luminosus TaxID=2038154 RepID=A0A8K0DCB9_IGNLU|nr:hypothetical protein ILUMI_02693 [Ignelater luminosus]